MVLECFLDRRGNRFGIDGFEVEGWGNYRNVSERENALRRNVDCASADLRGVLGGSDHCGANSLFRDFDARSPCFEALADGACEDHAQIAMGRFFPAVEVFGYASGNSYGVDFFRNAGDKIASGTGEAVGQLVGERFCFGVVEYLAKLEVSGCRRFHAIDSAGG